MGSRRRKRRKFPRRYTTIEYYECIGYNAKGQGIVIFNDKPFNVDELLLGEKARMIVYFEEEESGEARAVDIKNPSPDRALPLGHPKFSLGSYHIPHMSEKAQDA